MRKHLVKILVVILAVAMGCVALVACNPPAADGPKDGQFTVKFIGKDGTTVATKYVDKDATVEAPTAAAIDGYEFVRWYAVPTLDRAFDFSMKITKDTSVFAGYRSTAEDARGWYLAGAGKVGEWSKKDFQWKAYLASEEKTPPESLTLTRDATQKNKFSITLDLYKTDEFQFLNNVDGFNTAEDKDNQLGFGWVTPEQYSVDTSAPLYGVVGALASSPKDGNITCGQDGNYTLTVITDKDGKLHEWSYKRNGDATPLPTTYEYYIKGEKVTAWQNMIVDYTHFSTEDHSIYTLIIGMQKDDNFMIVGTETGTTDVTLNLNTGTIKLAEDEKTAAAIKVGMRDNNGTQQPTGNIQTLSEGTFKFTFDSKTNTLSAEKITDSYPEYDYYVKGSIGGDTTWQERHPMTYNAETKEYELKDVEIAAGEQFMVTVVAKGETEFTNDTEIFGVGTKYAAGDNMSNQIDVTTTNFKAISSDTFTIAVSEVSMRVTVTGANDIVEYAVHAKGTFVGGENWSVLKAGTPNEDKTVFTVELEFAEGGVVGFLTAKANDPLKTQIKWGSTGNVTGEHVGFDVEGNNIACTTAGTYIFTVTINADDATFTSIEIASKA